MELLEGMTALGNAAFAGYLTASGNYKLAAISGLISLGIVGIDVVTNYIDRRMEREQRETDAAWKLGNAECRMEEALSSMLSYTDALRVAVALNDYADRVSAQIECRKKGEGEELGHAP